MFDGSGHARASSPIRRRRSTTHSWPRPGWPGCVRAVFGASSSGRSSLRRERARPCWRLKTRRAASRMLPSTSSNVGTSFVRSGGPAHAGTSWRTTASSSRFGHRAGAARGLAFGYVAADAAVNDAAAAASRSPGSKSARSATSLVDNTLSSGEGELCTVNTVSDERLVESVRPQTED